MKAMRVGILVSGVLLSAVSFAANVKINVYVPPELKDAFIADTTTQYRATLVHNLASDTLTLTARNPTAPVVIKSSHAYIAWYVMGMDTERFNTRRLLDDFTRYCGNTDYFNFASTATWSKGTCEVALTKVSTEIQAQDDPLVILSPLEIPPSTAAVVVSTPVVSTGTCTVTLSKTEFYSGSLESNWNVAVTATCPWTVESDAPWIMLNPKATGFDVRVLTNTGPFRKAHLTVGGQTYLVQQDGG